MALHLTVNLTLNIVYIGTVILTKENTIHARIQTNTSGGDGELLVWYNAL